MIQIIGTKKNRNTSKAIRFFKERGVDFQFKDLNVKELAVGELKKISSVVPPDELIDISSATYKKKGMQYMQFDSVEEILEDNSILMLPIIRDGNKVVVGDKVDIWKKWVIK